MTHEKELFRDLKPTGITKVKNGNRDTFLSKGRGLLPLQAIQDEYCLIEDATNQDIFKVKMNGKSFAFNPLDVEQYDFPYKEDYTQIWHKRVGHYHHQGLLQLIEKELALDFPSLVMKSQATKRVSLKNKAVMDQTPFKAWYGYKPSLELLKVFGCLCFTHVPQRRRDKLGKRASPGMTMLLLCVDDTIKDFGVAKYFLGFEIARSPHAIAVTQSKYIKDIIQDTGFSQLTYHMSRNSSVNIFNTLANDIWMQLHACQEAEYGSMGTTAY
ncbi:UNVERIFIED_CONTAM: hypothetical protein Scaly_2212800 [Sesamum calycinum]|uniref:Polyprotein n=1 Tax=Sesamum calycinum TaxID=2727403 RepID=A0AAW2MRD8_9LAMI